MEWSAPVIVLSTRPFGEADLIARVFGAEQGMCAGLARGGGGRRGAALWQRGNLIAVRWIGRLAEQLGSFSAELIYPAAALAMADGLQLALLNSALAVAEGALPEHEPHPDVFAGLIELIRHLPDGPAALALYVRWEIALLAAVGYGLDLSRCAVSGRCERLLFVSPRTGRAVSEEAAGAWRERLLKLPAFLLWPATSDAADSEAADSDAAAPDAADWRDGLALGGHFLARHVFGQQHRPLPEARLMLFDRVAAMADEMKQACLIR